MWQWPQAMLNGTTTRSPIDRLGTPAPTASTVPIGSWPSTSPAVMNGAITLYRCRSDPQRPVLVMRTIASVGASITGSGTVSVRTSPRPCHTTAFIADLLGRSDATFPDWAVRKPIHDRSRPPSWSSTWTAIAPDVGCRASVPSAPPTTAAPQRLRAAGRSAASGRGAVGTTQRRPSASGGSARSPEGSGVSEPNRAAPIALEPIARPDRSRRASWRVVADRVTQDRVADRLADILRPDAVSCWPSRRGRSWRVRHRWRW